MAGRRRPTVGLRPHMLALRGEAAALFRPAAGGLTKRPACSLASLAPILFREAVHDGAQPAARRGEEQPAHIDDRVNPGRVALLEALPVVGPPKPGAAP